MDFSIRLSVCRNYLESRGFREYIGIMFSLFKKWVLFLPWKFSRNFSLNYRAGEFTVNYLSFPSLRRTAIFSLYFGSARIEGPAISILPFFRIAISSHSSSASSGRCVESRMT